MDHVPSFAPGSNNWLSIGLTRGGKAITPTSEHDWRTATVDLVIPTFNEEENIVRCLASVVRQTRRPRKIVVVDDASTDRSASRARRFGNIYGIDLVVITRLNPTTKMSSLKDQARALDSDVLFVLGADTILESDNYIERTVQELHQSAGIARACGSILPLREKDRLAADQSVALRPWLEASPSYRLAKQRRWLGRLRSAMTNLYSEMLYRLQRLILDEEFAVFGTMANPAGCAVAYRRAYLEALFSGVRPVRGDDYANSGDTPIGMAMLSEGYRNILVTDVSARTPPSRPFDTQRWLLKRTLGSLQACR
jgi:glycosyltransferase involved in cell wall biosynthesis